MADTEWRKKSDKKDSRTPRPIPVSTIEGVTVRVDDLVDLTPNRKCVNDNIINAFLILVRTTEYAVFNTFFYNMLTNQADGLNHVLRRKFNKELEECSFLFIPLHSHDAFHWGLAVLSKADAIISFFDSLPKDGTFCLNSIKKWAEAVGERNDTRGLVSGTLI